MQASVCADVIWAPSLDDPTELVPTLGEAARLLNAAFRPALSAPFTVDYGEEMRGGLSDPVQTPLCVSLLRETLAPVLVRVGVGFDTPAHDALARARREDRLVCYEGTGDAGDLLLNAFSLFVDPLLRERTEEQWGAVAAMRACGVERAAAERLDVGEEELAATLEAAHWHEIEQADAAVAAYLSALVMPAEL
jgi:hypothetical protein